MNFSFFHTVVYVHDKNDVTNEISEIPVGKKNGDGKGVECVWCEVAFCKNGDPCCKKPLIAVEAEVGEAPVDEANAAAACDEKYAARWL